MAGYLKKLGGVAQVSGQFDHVLKIVDVEPLLHSEERVETLSTHSGHSLGKHVNDDAQTYPVISPCCPISEKAFVPFDAKRKDIGPDHKAGRWYTNYTARGTTSKECLALSRFSESVGWLALCVQAAAGAVFSGNGDEMEDGGVEVCLCD